MLEEAGCLNIRLGGLMARVIFSYRPGHYMYADDLFALKALETDLPSVKPPSEVLKDLFDKGIIKDCDIGRISEDVLLPESDVNKIVPS